MQRGDLILEVDRQPVGSVKDVLENIERIIRLAGMDAVEAISPEALDKYRELNFLLNCLDRMEVRGRDSAGVQLSFTLKDNNSFSQVVEKLKNNMAVISKLRCHIRPECVCCSNVVIGIGYIVPVDDYVKAFCFTVIYNRPEKGIVEIIITWVERMRPAVAYRVGRGNHNP